MRRIALLAFLLIFVLLTSLFSSTALSSNKSTIGESIVEDPSNNDWWNNWIRDRNHNGIDDVLDDMIASNGETERTRIFIDYSRHPNQEDISRLSKFDFEVIYVYKYIDTICARNVIFSDIEKLAYLPGVIMVEYEDEVNGNLDISAMAVKARESIEYSPNTVHDMNILGRDISIAILDSGVDDGPAPAPPPYHNSLDDLDDDALTDDPKFIAGVDVTHIGWVEDGSWNPDDSGVPGHGTHVAGIAMGTGAPIDDDDDGKYDFRGVAPLARLVDVKVMERWGSGVMGEVIRGIDWSIDHKDEFDIRLLSMSIGGNYNSDGSDAASQAVNEAVDAGLIVVVAIGNDGTNRIPPPAAADKAIVVGAIDDMGTVTRSDDQIWGSSNIGPRLDDGDQDPLDELKPDVVAPGVNVMSAKSDTPGAYVPYSGTSMATPHVSGVIALMLEANPDLTPERVKEILHETAEMPHGIEPSTEYDEVYNYEYGWGMVDAYEAVRVAQQEDDRPPIISDIEEHISGVTATISWLTHKEANSIIDYGKSQDQLDQAMSDLDNYVFNHSITLTDLEEDTEYFYKIKGYDKQGYGPGESPIRNFITEVLPDTTPPEITNIVVAPTSTKTATIFWYTNELSDSSVEYGLTSEYGAVKSDFKLMLKHTITLFNLEPSKTYHFRVNSTDASGNYNYSEDNNFTTDEEPDETPPIISGLKVKDITETTATFVWETDEPSNIILRYNEDPNEDPKYWNDVSDLGRYWFGHSMKITGLYPSTVYYYQLVSADPDGNTLIEGGESYKFNTTGPVDNTPPRIIDGPKVTILTDKTATIEWTTDEESEGTVEYGSNYGSREPKDPSGEYVLVHNITLTGLTPSSTYHYRVRSKDISPNANENVSDDYSFITKPPADKKPPRILAGPRLLEVGEHTATIIWTTNEESDSELHYGTTPNYGTIASDDSLVIEHWIILTGLTPLTTYHYNVTSKDASGNSVKSDDDTFTTLDIPIPIEIEFFNFVDGKRVSGVITLDGSVSGGTGSIEWVKYKVDNETWQNLGSGSTFSIVLDTRKLSEGEHSLYVQAKVGDLTMQEDITFIVEHPQDNDEANWLMALLLIAAIGITIAAVLVISRSSSKKKAVRTTSGFMPPPTTSPEEPFPIPAFPPADTDVLKFLPDEQPLTFQEAEAGISFIPETTILSEEPEMSFVPDREPISFNISEEEAPDFSVFDTVRCPKCKRMFNADITLGIVCPQCGFSASIKK